MTPAAGFTPIRLFKLLSLSQEATSGAAVSRLPTPLRPVSSFPHPLPTRHFFCGGGGVSPDVARERGGGAPRRSSARGGRRAREGIIGLSGSRRASRQKGRAGWQRRRLESTDERPSLAAGGGRPQKGLQEGSVTRLSSFRARRELPFLGFPGLSGEGVFGPQPCLPSRVLLLPAEGGWRVGAPGAL